MAQKFLLNCLQTLGTTRVSLATSNVISSAGNSQEFYDFAIADAVRFYLDISVAGTSLTFNLQERDPATGVFFTNNPAGDPLFGVAMTTTKAGLITTIDPCYAEAYQISWTVTGSFTCSLLAQIIRRD